MRNIQKFITLGLMIALEIILSRFCSIATPITKIAFNFVPIVITAILYGPVYSGIVYACGDFIGAILFPIGPYFPGFTLSAFISGLIWGLFIYNKPRTLWRYIAASLINGIITTLVLNTLWLYAFFDNAFLALVPSRLIQFFITVPIHAILSYTFCYKIAETSKNNILFKKSGNF